MGKKCSATDSEEKYLPWKCMNGLFVLILKDLFHMKNEKESFRAKSTAIHRYVKRIFFPHISNYKLESSTGVSFKVNIHATFHTWIEGSELGM